MNKLLNTVIFFLFSSVTLFAMQMQKTGYQKFDGLIDLQEAGLPIPMADFVNPYSQKDEITEKVIFFIAQSASRLIALRPDGVSGIGETPAGIGFERTQTIRIINKLIEWSGKGYGVTLIEGNNRFNYDFCCNFLLLNEEGNFVIEFVGPGFDGGDLNKSILKPFVTVTNKIGSPIFIYSDPTSGEANIESLEQLVFRVNVSRRSPSEEEIIIRIKYIMEQLLPDMGIDIEKNFVATRKWLRENGGGRLFEKGAAGYFLSMKDLQDIVFYASLYAHNLLRTGRRLSSCAITAHKFDNKIVFFGTYNGKKWGVSKKF